MRRIAATILLILVLTASGVYHFKQRYLEPGRLREFLVQALGEVFTGRVELDSIRLLGLGTLEIRGLRLSSADGFETWLAIRELDLVPSVASLLGEGIRLDRCRVAGFEVLLQRTAAGGFTFERHLKLGAMPPATPVSMLAAAAAPGSRLPLAIETLTLSDGRLVYQDQSMLIDLSQIAGELTLTPEALAIHEIRARLKNLFPLTLKGSLPVGPAGQARLRVKIPKLSVAGLLACLPAMSLALSMHSEEIAGDLSLDLGLENPGGAWAGAVMAQGSGLRWESPRLVGLGATSEAASMELSYREDRDGAPVELKIHLDKGGVRPRDTAVTVGFVSLDLTAQVLDAMTRIDHYALVLPEARLEGAGFVGHGPGPANFEISFAGEDLELPELTSIGDPWFTWLGESRLSLRGRVAPSFVEFSRLRVVRPDTTLETTLAIDMSEGLPVFTGGEGHVDLPLESLLPEPFVSRSSGRVQATARILPDRGLPPVEAQLIGGTFAIRPLGGETTSQPGEILGGKVVVRPGTVELDGVNLILGGGEVELSGIVPRGPTRRQGEIVIKAAGIDLSPWLPVLGMGGVFTSSRLGTRGRIAIDLDRPDRYYDARLDLTLSPLHMAARPELRSLVVPGEGLTFPVVSGRVRIVPGQVEVTDISGKAGDTWLWAGLTLGAEQVKGQLVLKGPRIDPLSPVLPGTDPVRIASRPAEILLDVAGPATAPEIKVIEVSGE